MTNSLKAGIVAFVNAVLAALPLFGVPLNEAQVAALALIVNTGLGIWVALTYKNSPTYAPAQE